MSNIYRRQFSFFSHLEHDVYLDSAATTQKLDAVLERTDTFARTQNASVHRSTYRLAKQATKDFEDARRSIATLVNANTSDEIIFTSGATESLNMVAQGLSHSMLSGNTILICESEHHANILPWQSLAERLGLSIKVLPLSANGTFTQDNLTQWLQMLTTDVAIFVCAHASNVLGNIYPIKKLCEKAKSVQAISVIDGTQAIAHLAVNVQDLLCDFYVFSGHKMYGPTGIGVCWGRYGLLQKLNPSKLGGEMVTRVSFYDYASQPPPLKFEAGTPNIIGALGLHQASMFLAENIGNIQRAEHELYQYLCQQLQQIAGIRLLGNQHDSIAVISFYVVGIDNHALSLQLYAKGVALRFGQHCAMPLMQALGLSACLRVSLACYNHRKDIDLFIRVLNDAIAESSSNNRDHDAFVIGTQAKQNDWEQSIKAARGWSEKHRQLLLLSKSLPVLDIVSRTPDNSLEGCEAKVWICREDAKQSLRAYSDSKVIRGILAVLLLKHALIVQEEGIEKAAMFDFISYLSSLGLTDYFSHSRNDGVQSVVLRIRELSRNEA